MYSNRHKLLYKEQVQLVSVLSGLSHNRWEPKKSIRHLTIIQLHKQPLQILIRVNQALD